MEVQFQEVMEFRLSLNAETDRGCALMSAAFLDTELETLLRSFLADDAVVANELLGQNRPVGTFSARIDIAYLLGLISPASRRDFHLIRKIRNVFGHTHRPASFEDQEISNRCRELTHHLRDPAESPRKLFVSASVGLLAMIHTAMNNRARLVVRQNPDLDRAKFRQSEVLSAALGAQSDDT